MSGGRSTSRRGPARAAAGRLSRIGRIVGCAIVGRERWSACHAGHRDGYTHGIDGVDLIPGAFVDVLRGAQRRAGSEPNLTRKRVATLLHDRGWLQRDDARGTYGTRRRIGDRQVPVWPIALDVVFGVQTFIDDTDPDVVRASLLVRDQLDAVEIDPTETTNTERSATTSKHADEPGVLL